MNRRSIKRRKLGQHFLTDGAVADRIVAEAGVNADSHVLEIGPGKGFLTERLIATGAKVHAVEIDTELYEGLGRKLANSERFSIELGNALKFDFNTIEQPYMIVSNLPYSVAVAIIKKIIDSAPDIESMTLMVQMEVAKRLTAQPGDSSYGSLSIYTAFHMKADYLFTVPRTAFRPNPEIESAVIRLAPNENSPVKVSDEEKFFRLVKTAFGHRRKTIRNNLAASQIDGALLVTALENSGINPMARPQELSLGQFAQIYNEWEKISGAE